MKNPSPDPDPAGSGKAHVVAWALAIVFVALIAAPSVLDRPSGSDPPAPVLAPAVCDDEDAEDFLSEDLRTPERRLRDSDS